MLQRKMYKVLKGLNYNSFKYFACHLSVLLGKNIYSKKIEFYLKTAKGLTAFLPIIEIFLFIAPTNLEQTSTNLLLQLLLQKILFIQLALKPLNQLLGILKIDWSFSLWSMVNMFMVMVNLTKDQQMRQP